MLGVGTNYANRIKVYSTVFISGTLALDLLFFLAASQMFPWSAFSLDIWISLGVWAVCLNIMSFKILYPLSYLNEKTSQQIERVTQLKAMMLVLVKDKEIALLNPLHVKNRA